MGIKTFSGTLVTSMLSIPFSYVSSLTNYNQYKDVKTETAIVLHKYNSHSDPKKKKKTRFEKSQFPLLRDLEENHTAFYTAYINAMKIKQYERQADKLMKTLCRKHALMYRHHKSLLYKKRGFVMEKFLIAKFEGEYKVCVKPCEQITRYCEIGDYMLKQIKSVGCYRLIGKADGVYKDTVIECKCRRNGFRNFFFEKIQLALYVLGYQKRQGKLVEMFEGELRVYTMGQYEAMQIFHDVKGHLDAWVNANIKNIKPAQIAQEN